jgi:hypothetical protein
VPDAIGLAAFVASVLSPSADGHRIPMEWRADMEGLPGFDGLSGTVRLTDDPSRSRDAQGRPLLYPGRSHPLARRAIALARTGASGQVSAARREALSLLITYAAEIGDRSGTLLRRVFALLVFPDGTIQDQMDVLAPADHAVSPDRLWLDRFAAWAPAAIKAADRRRAAVADEIASGFFVSYEQKLRRDTATLDTWLARRTNELCGVPVSPVDDLFNPAPEMEGWRSGGRPVERLAAFADDDSLPILQRREAAEILGRLRSIAAERSPLSKPVVRTLGMLMLVPSA